MADQVTEVTSQSWLSRIGGAFKGILFGLLLFVIAFVVLFWNEGRAVKRHKALQEGSGIVASVDAGTVEKGNEGKLIHLTGEATTEEVLADADFPVSSNALRLRRSVEIYQWQESSSKKTRKKVGGGSETTTTYRYGKGWSSRLEDSSGFKEPAGHENPSSVRFDSREETAQDVTLGAFHLSSSDVQSIDEWTGLTVDPAAALPEGTSAWSGGVYSGENPDSPEVGDLRITFAAVKPMTISLVGLQQGETIGTYRTANGGEIHLLDVGAHSAAEMFQAAESANATMTWILRGAGFLAMFLGLVMILAPLRVLADVIPFVGRMVGAGTGLIAFLVAAIFSTGTVALAWIVYRPLIGIALLAVMAGAAALVVMKTRTCLPYRRWRDSGGRAERLGVREERDGTAAGGHWGRPRIRSRGDGSRRYSFTRPP